MPNDPRALAVRCKPSAPTVAANLITWVGSVLTHTFYCRAFFWQLLGRVCRKFHNGNDKARNQFEQAIALDNSYIVPVFALSELEMEEGNHPEAIALFVFARRLWHAR